jgi:hypothetical protein
MAVGPILLFATRLNIMDFSTPTSYDPYYILIPKPTVQPNFAAPWKPFAFSVG